MLTYACGVKRAQLEAMEASASAGAATILPLKDGNVWFMLIAHFLYSNAVMKGEECIPFTWDIFHEKFGFMLIFWNCTGVPFLYCLQSFYLVQYRNRAETK